MAFDIIYQFPYPLYFVADLRVESFRYQHQPKEQSKTRYQFSIHVVQELSPAHVGLFLPRLQLLNVARIHEPLSID